MCRHVGYNRGAGPPPAVCPLALPSVGKENRPPLLSDHPNPLSTPYPPEVCPGGVYLAWEQGSHCYSSQSGLPQTGPPSHSLSLSPVSVFEIMSTHYPHCGYVGKGIKGNMTGEMLVSVSKISCSKDLQTCFPCSYLPEQSFGPNGGGIIPPVPSLRGSTLRKV